MLNVFYLWLSNENWCLQLGIAVDKYKKITLLSTFIYFNMQQISLIFPSIYVPKHISIILYILIY